MSKKLKTLAFDLDTKALQESYPKKDWNNAYNDIKNFLKENGFIWQQGSVYDSTTKMTDRELGDLVDMICDRFSWFPYSINSLRGYDQPEIIDYTQQAQRSNISIDKNLNLKATQQKINKTKN